MYVTVDKINKRERGTASILALLVMILLLALGATIMSVSSTEVRTAAAFRDGVAAQFTAEAGAKRALLAISTNNGNLPSPIKDEPLGPGLAGTYSVTVEQQGVNRIITATGTVNKASRQVVLEVTPETVYDFAAYSNGNMTLGLNSINGSVGSNRDIYFTALTRIYGDAIAHGRVWLYTGLNDIRGRILDSTTNPAPPSLPIPTFERDTFKDGLRPTLFMGIWWLSPDNLDGKVWYYDGDLLFASSLSSIKGPGVIYATGNIDIGVTKITNNVILISEKNINVPVGAYIDNSALVARGNIEISISGFNGSAVAGGTIFAPANFMSHPPAKSAYNVTKNPYIPQPPLWLAERVKVGYWDNKKN